jgi:hypothetical protein
MQKDQQKRRKGLKVVKTKKQDSWCRKTVNSFQSAVYSLKLRPENDNCQLVAVN